MDAIQRSCELCDTDITTYPLDTIHCGPCADTIKESIEKSKPQMSSITDLLSKLASFVLGPEEEPSTQSKENKQDTVRMPPRAVKPKAVPRSPKSNTKTSTDTIQISCCSCKTSFTALASESWKTMCLSCYRKRQCENCNTDISSLAKSRVLCDACYKSQLISKKCTRCSREFLTNREHIRKRYCGKSDCVSLTPDQQKVVSEKLKTSGYSKKEILWLTYVFYGHHYHGHPTRDSVGVDGKSYRELYESTMRREELIRAEGYTIVSIWEEDYDKLKL